MNVNLDRTLNDRTQRSVAAIAVLGTVAVTWMASAGVFVGESQFVFNMNTGRWMNTTANRTATAGEAEAAQRAAMANAGTGSRGVWDLGFANRGYAIEQRLGGNLPQGFETIDRFSSGVATSIKSMDMAAPATTVEYISTTGRGYIDTIASFNGRARAGVRITESQITSRAVDLAISPGASQAQRQALQQMVEYGRARGVTVNVIELPW